MLNNKVWSERYFIEGGPSLDMMSRLAQTAASLKIPQDLYFTISKEVAPTIPDPVLGIQWDRISLDSQKLIVTLKHISSLGEHYWQIEGEVKAAFSVHDLRNRHREDYGLALFKKGQEVKVYYQTVDKIGWVGPMMDKDSQIVLRHHGQKMAITLCCDDPEQYLAYQVKRMD